MASVVDFMRFQFIIVLLWASSVMGGLKVLNYTQQLDHFINLGSNDPTFQQKLLVNDDYWAGAKTGAPIFVMLGDVVSITNNPIDYGILYLSAVKFGAMLIHIEHRYYGDSIPLGSIDKAMADQQIRKYLSVDQTLQDYAVIIQSLKANLSAHNSPVIVVGMGYAGALATWFQLKYPYISVGALASSTPLLYYGNTHPGDGYCSIVSRTFKDLDPLCYNRIRQSWKVIDDFALRPNGLAELSQRFKTCRPLKSTEELKRSLAQLFSFLARSDDVDHMLLSITCLHITVDKDLINGLVTALQSNEMSDTSCLDILNLTGVESPFEFSINYTTAWAWLRCNEVIFTAGCKHSTMLPSQPFDMVQFEKSCKARFGNFIASPRSPIDYLFGSQDIVEVLSKFKGNIILSNGMKDPFSVGGILKDLSKTVIAITATNGTYSWDMQTIQNNDPKWLRKKRDLILHIMEKWINRFHDELNNKGSERRTCKNLLFYLLVELFIHVPELMEVP